MSAILSELRNLFSTRRKDDDEFIYFWDDIRETEETLVSQESKSLGDYFRERQLLITHALLFFIVSITLFSSTSSVVNSGTILGYIAFLLILVVSYFLTYQRVLKPYDIIKENVERAAENNLTATDELLYNKAEYPVLESFNNFMDNISVNLQALQRSSHYYQEEITRFQHHISRVRSQLDDINIELDNTLASAAQYQNLLATVGQVSDGVDLLTENFDNALNGIDEISSIVNSIGKQTTMLALNAGIEAARAGEMGRGFEVVASNLRRLAQHAVKSSNDIQNMSKEISMNAKEALEDITQGMSTLRRNMDQDHQMILEINTTLYNNILQLGNVITENQSLVNRIQENSSFLDGYDF